MALSTCVHSFEQLKKCSEAFSGVDILAIILSLLLIGFFLGILLTSARRQKQELTELPNNQDIDEELAKTRHELQEARQRLHNLDGQSPEGNHVRFRAILRELCNEESVWLRPPHSSVDGYHGRMARSIPVIYFASTAGGAGKTTLAAGMAGYFSGKGERVLVIDLDAYARLSAQMRAQVGQGIAGQEMSPGNMRILGRSLSDGWTSATILDADDYLDYITSSPAFAEYERCLEMRWIFGQTEDDARFRLARTILSEQVQSQYDRVIIDGSSHIGMGFINGLFAATHIFVPTRMDRLSLGSLLEFVRFFTKLKSETEFAGEFSGAIGTMIQGREAGQRLESQKVASEMIAEQNLIEGSQHFLKGGFLPYYAKMGQASARGLPYLTDPSSHAFFDPLGKAIGKIAPSPRKSLEKI